MANTTISLRIPMTLVQQLDEEAKGRKRSRAFVIIEKLEEHYTTNGNGKPTAKARKKVTK